MFLKHKFLKFAEIMLGIFTLSLIDNKTSCAGERPPNIVEIMPDQHNARTMSCAGHYLVKTPNLDRIAKEGVMFTNAFVTASVCSPSRASLITGLYVESHGVRGNEVPIPLELLTIAEVLRDRGYATCAVGKMHLEHPPQKYGYNESFEKDYGQYFGNKGLSKYKDDVFDDIPIAWKVGILGLPDEETQTAYWARQTVEFIKKHKDEPFYICFHPNPPHDPYLAPQPYVSMYNVNEIKLPKYIDNEWVTKPVSHTNTAKAWGYYSLTDDQIKRSTVCYLGLVSHVDRWVGYILDALKELGLEDNTIVIYTADHGDMVGEHRSFGKGHGMYDSTTRVPLLIRYPKAFPKGKVINELVSSIDYVPTLLELTSTPVPDEMKNLPGKSLVPLVQSRAKKLHDVVFAGDAGRKMIRTETWKLIFYGQEKGTPGELYNLKDDPGELYNLITNSKYENKIQELKGQYDNWWSSIPHAPQYKSRPVLSVDRFRKDRAAKAAARIKERIKKALEKNSSLAVGVIPPANGMNVLYVEEVMKQAGLRIFNVSPNLFLGLNSPRYPVMLYLGTGDGDYARTYKEERDAEEALLNYMKGGGILISIASFPFYYPCEYKDENWVQIKGAQGRLGDKMGLYICGTGDKQGDCQGWKDPPEKELYFEHVQNDKIFASLPGKIPFSILKDKRYRPASSHLLSREDEFIPILNLKSEDGNSYGPAIAVIKRNSGDFKNATIIYIWGALINTEYAQDLFADVIAYALEQSVKY